MGQTNLNIRIDEDVKNEFEKLCDEFGMSMSTAVNVFIKATIREQQIPFKVAKLDGFYNPHNLKRLRETIANKGKQPYIVKTMEELEAMENE